MIAKLRKFLEFNIPALIENHFKQRDVVTALEIQAIKIENTRTREVIDAMVECVEGFILLARLYHQENCAGDVHSPICENCSEGIARLQERLEKVK